jgi:hypothetical protein
MAVIDDLKAYYPLDEASGDAIDAHGANDLTDTNTVGAATGKVSGARDFEFTNSERFLTADNTDLSLGSDTAFTWAGWVQNEQDFQSGTAILGKGATNAAGMAYQLWINGGSFRFEFTVGNGSSSQTVTNTSVFPTPAGTWFFIAAWHDPTADKIYLQIDNGTPAEAAWSGGTQDEANNFELGRDSNVIGSHWDGLLDEWGFWKRVLTSDERTWLYNSGSGRSYADIVAEDTPESTPARIIFQKA